MKKAEKTLQLQADELGISKRTLCTYRKAPSFPRDGTRNEKLAWMAEKKMGLKLDGEIAGDSPLELIQRKRLADAKWKEEKARLAKLDRMFKEGKLIERSVIESHHARIATALKNTLLDIPKIVRSEIITLLTNPVDAGHIEELIDRRIRDAMNQAVEELNNEN